MKNTTGTEKSSNFTILHSRPRNRARAGGQNYFPIDLETQWETLSFCCSKWCFSCMWWHSLSIKLHCRIFSFYEFVSKLITEEKRKIGLNVCLMLFFLAIFKAQHESISLTMIYKWKISGLDPGNNKIVIHSVTMAILSWLSWEWLVSEGPELESLRSAFEYNWVGMITFC